MQGFGGKQPFNDLGLEGGPCWKAS